MKRPIHLPPFGRRLLGNGVKQIPVVTINLEKAPQQIHDAFNTLKDYFSSFVD